MAESRYTSVESFTMSSRSKLMLTWPLVLVSRQNWMMRSKETSAKSCILGFIPSSRRKPGNPRRDDEHCSVYNYDDRGTTDYGYAKGKWADQYAYYALKGRWQTGDGYKNDVEKWAQNRKFEILSAILSNKQLVQQGNVCGYDLTTYSLTRPNW